MSVKQLTFNHNRLFSLLIAMIIALSLTACETKISAAGSQVRDMSGQDVSNCEFIQVVEASEMWGNSVAGDKRSAVNKLRNKVIDVGGNAFTVDSFDSSVLQSVVQAEALRC
jgi:hypothetical protein